jgi:penicillin-binding protein 1C
MWNVSGITGAAPVWVEVMNWLHRHQTGTPPEPPAELVAGEVALPGWQKRKRREWFIRGTEAEAVVSAHSPAGSQIVYPAAGTVIALDPDIPPRQQKLFFEAAPESRNLFWVLNGERLGPAASLLLWTPAAGKHTLALADTRGEVRDSVRFEVRGNPVPK